MGLDAVEIVMRVEKTFDIKIKDAEAEAIRTVGDMHNIVWSKIDGKPSESCVSQSIFYKLRSSITDIYGADRANITPSTMLPAIIPNKQHPGYWQSFSRATSFKLPELIYRAPYSNIRYLLSVNIIVCCIISILFALHYSSFWPLLLIPASYILWRVFNRFFSDKKTAAPEIDIRQFVAQVFALNFDNLTNTKGEAIYIGRVEMERVINNLIVDVLGVDIEEVTPEKSFVKDLGL